MTVSYRQGLRRGALSNLRWIQNGQILVDLRNCVLRVSARQHEGTPMHEKTRWVLGLIWERVISRDLDTDGHVFVDNDGRPFDRDWISEEFARTAERAGLTGCTFDDLRRSYRPEASSNSVQIKEASETQTGASEPPATAATKPAETPKSTQPAGTNRKVRDFRSLRWGTATHSFTAKQAVVVEALYKAWQAGEPDIGNETLLEAAGSEGKRLKDIFRGNPAWQTLIVLGATKGSYRLTNPPQN